jgi:hypothetical protein
MLKSEQRRTYLAKHICCGKSEPVNAASLVAAPNPDPPAAVLLAVAAVSPPRVEEAFRISGDAMLESQQGVPLVRQVARTRSVATSGCWLGLVLRVHGEEEE